VLNGRPLRIARERAELELLLVVIRRRHARDEEDGDEDGEALDPPVLFRVLLALLLVLALL
jgi:hypothetical protein